MGLFCEFSTYEKKIINNNKEGILFDHLSKWRTTATRETKKRRRKWGQNETTTHKSLLLYRKNNYYNFLKKMRMYDLQFVTHTQKCRVCLNF